MDLFHRLSPRRQGELLVLAEAVLWGLFPVISTLSFSSVTPLFSAGLSLLFSLLYFAPAAWKQNCWHELRIRTAWLPILGSALLLGVAFYLLVFLGTARSSPGNVSILMLLEVLTTAAVFHLWGKERLTRLEAAGSLLVLTAAVLVLFPGRFRPNSGDLLILLAVSIAPFGNHYSKVARAQVSTTTLMLVRNSIAAVILLAIAAASERAPTASELRSSLPTLLINGILLLGFSKVLWVEAIYRLPISKAIGLSSVFPVITLLASKLLLDLSPSWWQLAAVFPAMLGVVLLSAGPPAAELPRQTLSAAELLKAHQSSAEDVSPCTVLEEQANR